MEHNIWKKDDEEVFEQAYLEVDHYFEDLYEKSLNGDGVVNFVYSEGCHNFSLDVMEAIRDKHILLIQAGTGVKRTFGYLIPIFYMIHNKPEFRAVISTSNLFLQKELRKDVYKVSKLLNINIQFGILNDFQNYACIGKIEALLRNTDSPAMKNLCLKIKDRIDRSKSCDRDDLFFISNQVWSQIQLTKRKNCSNCSYSSICFYQKMQKEMKKWNIVITNHDNFIYDSYVSRDESVYGDMVIFDEAHLLEERLNSVVQKHVKLKDFVSLIDQVVEGANLEYCDYYFFKEEASKLKQWLVGIFDFIKNSSHGDKRFRLQCNDEMQKKLRGVILQFQRFYKSFNGKSKSVVNWEYLHQLKKMFCLFQDMSLGGDSRYFYWVSLGRELKICYFPRKITNVVEKCFPKNIPIVCSSETMLDQNKTYHSFCNVLGLDQLGDREIIYGDEQVSFFDYPDQLLFYLDTSTSFSCKYQEYIQMLAFKIKEFIQITSGKSFVLFPSKKCMRDVYRCFAKEQFGFPLLLQTDENAGSVFYQFMCDVDSCLFATDYIFDGIDVKGSSFSNLIIIQLPFSDRDIIFNQSKDVSLEDDNCSFRMLIKLNQAVHRLIRTRQDTGIVCCLDNRAFGYLDSIQKMLPPMTYTTDINDIIQFSNQKIILDNNYKELKKIKKDS